MSKSDRILHFSLFTVSTYMSVMMFIIIGNSLPTKIALALLALIFELTKLSDLHKIQSDVKKKFVYVTSYGLKALLSVIASAGLVMTLLSAQGDSSDLRDDVSDAELESHDAEVTYWEKEIDLLDQTVILLNENLARNPEGYGISGKTFVSQIQAVQETKEQYWEMYQNAVKDRLMALSEASMESVVVDPVDMFDELESIFPIDAQSLKILVFSLIMILVEISLALTGVESSVIHPESTDSETASPESKAVSPKSIHLEIVRHQASREKSDAELLSQSQLAEKLGVSRATINNSIRRHIKPVMMENGIKNYVDLYHHLKKAI